MKKRHLVGKRAWFCILALLAFSITWPWIVCIVSFPTREKANVMSEKNNAELQYRKKLAGPAIKHVQKQIKKQIKAGNFSVNIPMVKYPGYPGYCDPAIALKHSDAVLRMLKELGYIAIVDWDANINDKATLHINWRD